jgi:hypothetical protein
MDLNNIPPSAYSIGATALISGGIYVNLTKKIKKLKKRIGELEEELDEREKKTEQSMNKLELQLADLRRQIASQQKDDIYIPKERVERPVAPAVPYSPPTRKTTQYESEEDKIARLMSD